MTNAQVSTSTFSVLDPQKVNISALDMTPFLWHMKHNTFLGWRRHLAPAKWKQQGNTRESNREFAARDALQWAHYSKVYLYIVNYNFVHHIRPFPFHNWSLNSILIGHYTFKQDVHIVYYKKKKLQYEPLNHSTNLHEMLASVSNTNSWMCSRSKYRTQIPSEGTC